MLAELETDAPDDFFADAADIARRAKELQAKLKKAIAEVAELRMRNPTAADLEEEVTWILTAIGRDLVERHLIDNPHITPEKFEEGRNVR